MTCSYSCWSMHKTGKDGGEGVEGKRKRCDSRLFNEGIFKRAAEAKPGASRFVRHVTLAYGLRQFLLARQLATSRDSLSSSHDFARTLVHYSSVTGLSLEPSKSMMPSFSGPLPNSGWKFILRRRFTLQRNPDTNRRRVHTVSGARGSRIFTDLRIWQPTCNTDARISPFPL